MGGAIISESGGGIIPLRGAASSRNWGAASSGISKPIVRIAHLVGEIEFCDRQIGRLNATSAVRLGYVPMVLAGTAPAIKALFQDALVWDAFIAVAGLQPPPAAG